MIALGPFAQPEALSALLVVPVVGILLVVFARSRSRRLIRAAGPRGELLSRDLSPARRRIRIALFTAAMCLAVIALAHPRWGRGGGSLERRGVDVVVCLDVSRSMLARDVEPSRLLRAREEISALAERTMGDRLALVVFAGEARLLVPLTRDMDSYVDLLSQADPLAAPSGGTDLGAAFVAALEALDISSDRPGVVLMLTDGDDLGGRGEEKARACDERGIGVICVGIGTELGAKVPVETAAGEAFLRDRSGREVIASLDAGRLRRVAEAAGGEYRSADGDSHALATLYDELIAPYGLNASVGAGDGAGENRYQWPLLLALLLWIADLCVSERRR